MIVWLSSYPRSGNTFFRVILNSVFDIKTYSIYDDTGDIGADSDTSEIVGHKFLPKDFDLEKARASNDTYYIKTHDLLDQMQLDDLDKVIYLVRDGRESTLSFTKHLQNFYGKENDDLTDVIYGYTPFGSWGEHVRQWKDIPQLRIKFEELTDDPSLQLHKISDFLGIKPIQKNIPTFKELKAINPKFFRNGKKDSWKQAYSQTQHLAFWLRNVNEMTTMNYLNDVPSEINEISFHKYAQLFQEELSLWKKTKRNEQHLQQVLKKQKNKYNECIDNLNAIQESKSNNLVTIVTVTYNAEDFLEETILSVINQSYKSIEYIIIDGASTDKTVDIIKKYEDHIDYWVSESDEGIYFAMNKAIEKATGEWINFMNAGDSFFDSQTVQYVMEKKNNDTELIYGNCQIGAKEKIPHELSRYCNITYICHQTLFAKTKLMKKTLFDTKYKISADHNFILSMFKKNKKFQHINRPIANYLLDGFSETQQLRMQIEGLFVLFTNNVPKNEIMQSPWYIDMSNDISKKHLNYISTLEKMIQDKEKFIQIQKEQLNQLYTLQMAVKEITNYSIWKQPLKKYKSYKAMLLIYHKIKNSAKRDKIDDK